MNLYVWECARYVHEYVYIFISYIKIRIDSDTQMEASGIIPGMRACTMCGVRKPATIEHFHKVGLGLRASCKPCFNGSRRLDPERDAREGPRLTVPGVNLRLSGVDDRVTGLEARMSGLPTAYVSVSDFSALVKDVREISSRQTAPPTAGVSAEEFKNLMQEVQELRAQIRSLMDPRSNNTVNVGPQTSGPTWVSAGPLGRNPITYGAPRPTR